MKILFIAYYFEPYQGVGAKRVSYWAKYIYEKSNKSIKPTVVTAIKPSSEVLEKYSDIIYIEDTKKSFYKSLFRNDNGITWINDLKKYFNSNVFDYDAVLITGGPFLHFGISDFLKKKYNCKIILDYRDPFAVNPLFENQNFIKLIVKKSLEKRFNRAADSIITVNKYCSNLLIQDGSKEIEIINNGFNEKYLNKINLTSNKLSTRIDIVYAGKLSHGRDITLFLDFITNNNNNIVFHYIGSDYKVLNIHENIIVYGEKSYKETLKIIANCDIGMVLTGGHAFESTTKIFDYIGLKKTVLVITEGDKYYGSINDILQSYPAQIWCKNTKDDFLLISQIYKPLDVDKNILFQYSREAGLDKLIKLIKKIK